MESSPKNPSGWRWALACLLVVSLGLRLILVIRGGQDFWADESRFSAAVAAVSFLQQGQWSAAVHMLIGTADHLGFKVLMLGPAWVCQHAGNDWRAASAILALISTANILWIWLLARRLGGGDREAFWSAAAMASANSMFYWVRHMMPYDVSMFWALACAYAAFRPSTRWGGSLLAGFLAFVAFVTYNGNWAMIACILTAHVLLAWPDWLAAARRAALGLFGLVGSWFALLLFAARFKIYLFPSYAGFAGSINQGDFNDGYHVFFDYLWKAEGATSLIWLAALAAFIWLVRSCSKDDRRRGWVWAGSIVAVAAILIVGSNVLEKFVVYGRLARQVVPFCALLTGWTAARVFGSGQRGRSTERVALLAMFGCAAWSMSVPLRQEFPVGFYARADQVAATYRREHLADEPAAVARAKFRYVFVGFIWPYPAAMEKPLPAHYRILLQSPHPLSWRPYLYEGFNRDQRAAFESTDISMRLILLQD